MTRPASWAAGSSAFFATVGRERCHIVLFDDLASDPRVPIARCARFLGIEPWSGTNFKPQRINKAIRIGWLQRLLKRPPKAIRTALAGEKFHKREKKVGSTDSRRSPPSSASASGCSNGTRFRPSASRSILASASRSSTRLRDDVILLSRVIDRDLSHWLGGVPEAKPQAGGQRRGLARQQQRSVAIAVEAVPMLRSHGHKPSS